MSTPAVLRLADGRVLHCGRILRSLPGKRRVAECSLDGGAVIVKVYLDAQRARVHWQREVDGLAALHRAGIAAPEVRYAGTDEAGHPVIVLGRIDDAIPLSAAWEAGEALERERLVGRMMRLLAEHHGAGIRQTDLHLDNFLVAGERIYSLDGAGVEARPGALDERRSLANLALFCAQLGVDDDPLCIAASTAYVDARGWDVARVDRQLPGLIRAQRQRRWDRLRGKVFRDCSAVSHRRVAGAEWLVARRYRPALDALLADPDASCPDDRALRLKDGNTATVWQVGHAGRAIVIKRYNVKDRLHGIMQSLKESRAAISWRNAHMLRLFGIATPAPVACVLRRDAPARRTAYFLSERVAGPSLRDWVAEHRQDPDRLRAQALELARLLARLRELRISHGDMKAANFICGADALYVIDLDAMRQHRTQAGFERAWRRDLRRLAANWVDQPAVAEIMRTALREVGMG